MTFFLVRTAEGKEIIFCDLYVLMVLKKIPYKQSGKKPWYDWDERGFVNKNNLPVCTNLL